MLKIYSIKDNLVGFNSPFVQTNDAVAVREFSNLVNIGENKVSVNFQDMDLYCLGEFDERTGEIISAVNFVIRAADVKKVDNDVL